MKLTDMERADINKIIHSQEWNTIIKVFREQEQDALNDLYAPVPSNPDRHILIGEAKTWNRCQKIFNEEVNKLRGNEE